MSAEVENLRAQVAEELEHLRELVRPVEGELAGLANRVAVLERDLRTVQTELDAARRIV